MQIQDKFNRLKHILPRFLARFTTGTLLILLALSEVNGQEVEVVKVGQYWAVQTDDGSLGPVNFEDGWFPADFNVVGQEMDQGTAVTGNLFLAADEWTDPEGNVLTNVVNGLQSVYDPAGIVVEPQKSYIRYGYPDNEVQGESYRLGNIGEVDPSQMVGTADQVLTVTNEYTIGVQIERDVYAWSQQNHDSYVINDVYLTNVSEQTFNEFWIFFSREHDYDNAWGNNPSPSGLVNDHFAWQHYYGAAPGDSQRVFYSYHADDPRVDGDQMANPALGQQGRLIDFQMQWHGWLHVSQPYSDPANDVNDPTQPSVTFIAKGTLVNFPSPRSRYGIPLSAPDWYSSITGDVSTPLDPDAPPGTWHQLPNDEYGTADFSDLSAAIIYSGTQAGANNTIGPYTFAPGETIHLIYAFGQSGISPQKATEVGNKMVNNNLNPPPDLPDPDKGYFPDEFVFPDGATEQDIRKDLWVSTGIDSVHKDMYHARWNFNHNWQVPQAPPPPNQAVTGYPDNATITWSDPDAEAMSNFAGYRIRRRKSKLDTAFYKTVARFNPSDLSSISNGDGGYEYQDTEVQFGASYTYYVQAGVQVPATDMNALPSQRGEILWSGRTYIPTPESIEPPRAGSETLTDIQIAPNPYNINDPKVQAQGWTDFRGILFFNLPSYCEIDIYTEDGDQVKEIIHESAVGAGSLRWDMITESDQVIASGVYIATFSDDQGNVAFRKFVVVR